MNKRLAVFFVVLLASILLEWWTRACHFIMTPDSDYFLAASRSFRESGIFLNPDGSRFTNWPPLFPWMLSLFVNPAAAVVWINILCKIVIGIVVFYFTRTFIRHSLVAGFYLVAVLLSVHFLMISVFMWSEMIFMALLYLNIYAAFKLKNNPANYYLMLLTGFLFCLQRHVGMFWVAGTCIWLMLEAGRMLKTKAIRSLSYFITCTAGLWIWNFYNAFFITEKSVFDDRSYFSDTFLNIGAILQELSQSVFPFRGWWATLCGVLLAAALIYFIIRHFKADSRLQLLSIGLLTYTACFIPVSFIATDVDRYYSVMVPIVFLFLFMLAEYVVAFNPKMSLAVFIVIALWMVYPLVRTSKNALLWGGMSCRGVSIK